jgi:hypothetical protein
MFVLITLVSMAEINTNTTQATKPTNAEIATIVAMSKEANMANGVLNPDLIQPGQNITFLFQDGTTGTIVVSAGESQWSIIRNKLADMQIKHGDVVPYVEPAKPVQPEVLPKKAEVVTPPIVQESSIDWLFWLTMTALALIVAGVIMLIKRLQYKNPATAGPAFRAEGIRYGQENEHQALEQEFRRQYGPNARIENVRRCTLTTPGFTRRRVRFANGTTQMLMLRKERGYEANVDGVIRYIIGDCANGFGSASRHMTGEGLIVEYMENVPQPQPENHDATNTGTEVTVSQPQLDALVKVTDNIKGGLAEFSKNGGKINLVVSRKVGEGNQAVTDSVSLTMDFNAPVNELPALNGTYKAYMLTPLKKADVVEVQKAEKTA